MIANFIFYFIFLVGSISATLRSRIIGGLDADIEDFPFLASIRIRGSHYCGGSIISKKHILTAAHCINKFYVAPYEDVSIHTGTSSSREIGQSHRVIGVRVHPEYVGTMDASYINDLALITLADEIKFNDNQQKIDLTDRDTDTGVEGYLVGWGKLVPKKDVKVSIQLQKLKVTSLDSIDCQVLQRYKIHDNQICAFQSKGQGACFGDSGGPLVINNKLVGILSWISDGDCASGTPEVYTNVHAYRAFIDSLMNS